jgi:hypothetical protein
MMHHRLRRFALAGVYGLVTAAMILLIAYAVGFWIGGHVDNLWFLLKLTAPFALLLALVAAAWPEPNGTRGAISWFILITVGVSLGCAYWYLLARTMGLGLRSVAIQALGCWIAVAVTALVLALNRRSYGVLVSAILICALGVVLPSPAFNLFAHNQRLTVAIIVPGTLANVSAQPREVGFDSQSGVEKATSRVLQTIRAAGLQGNYRIVYLSQQGQGKQSLAILILNAPMNGRMLLAEPDAADVIYVQQPNGWTEIPAQAPTLRRKIEIWGAGNDRDSLAYFRIPDATGISLMGRVRTGEEVRQ